MPNEMQAEQAREELRIQVWKRCYETLRELGFVTDYDEAQLTALVDSVFFNPANTGELGA